jgi:glyoxylase-like metal-dependent hydrolase (beta-lactamase superfamily II)
MSIHALVIETKTRRIVVDTCIGNDKEGRRIPAWNRLQTAFLADLTEAGYPAETIDTVLCTHMHVDHVGWNTRFVKGAWVPTFPKARYLIHRDEFRYWEEASREGDAKAIFADSIAPVVAAGLVDLVATDHRLCEEVRLVPTPGHTPGHVSVAIASRGESALITGDFIHHPCQMARLDWASSGDYDRGHAAQTRRDTIAGLAGTPTLMIGTHFAGPTAGHVHRDGAAFRLEPVIPSAESDRL